MINFRIEPPTRIPSATCGIPLLKITVAVPEEFRKERLFRLRDKRRGVVRVRRRCRAGTVWVPCGNDGDVVRERGQFAAKLTWIWRQMSVIWRQIYVVMAANRDRAQVVGGKVSCKGSGKGMERGCQPHGDADRMRQGAATLRTESAFFSLMSHGPLV